MFIFLSKLLPLFIYPAGLATLLLLAALVLWRKRRLARLLVALSFLVILVAGNRWVAMAVVHSLESRYPPLAADVRADVIVLLGGGTEPQESPRPTVEVNGAGDRVYYAGTLYRQNVARTLLLTGGTIEWQGQASSTPAEDMAAMLRFYGVPGEALVLQGRSANTAEDAAYCAAIIRDRGWKRVVLVTSALHMPRSVALFEQMGIPVIPAPTDYTITDQGWKDLFSWRWENLLINLLPTSANLKSTTSAMKEYIGMAVNQLRY